MDLVFGLVAVVLVVMVFRLSSRISALERKLYQVEQLNHSSEAAIKAPPVPTPELAASREDIKDPPLVASSDPEPKSNPWEVAKGETIAPTRVVSHEIPRKEFVVFSADRMAAYMAFAARNWFYLVAAASLGLAGVFLVQYGIENGVLTPRMRVLAALVLAVVLVGIGEFLRRKGGDDPDELFAYLPSTFAAGGLISAFSGLLSARVLYDLISSGQAFSALAVLSVIAVGIGWFYGPILAAMGVLAALSTPFIIGGDPGMASLLYYYFALIVWVALLIDTMKRWAWLSSFAALLGFGAATMVYGPAGEDLHFLTFAILVVIGAIAVPRRQFVPRDQGATFSEDLILPLIPSRFRDGLAMIVSDGASAFPTRLAALTFLGATMVATLTVGGPDGGFWLAVAGLGVLLVIPALWGANARSLSDLYFLPLLGFVFVLVAEADGWEHAGSTFNAWFDLAGRGAEDPMPKTALMILLASLLASGLLLAQSFRAVAFPRAAAFAGAGFVPLSALIFEFGWSPTHVLGSTLWAFHVMGAAAIFVLVTGQIAKTEQDETRPRVAFFALASLALIAFGLTLVLTSSALSIAIAIMVLGTVWLDMRFNLVALSVFVVIGAAVVTFRSLIYPGIDWAIRADLADFLGVSGAVLLLMWAALGLSQRIKRPRTSAALETAFWTALGATLTAGIVRLFDLLDGGHEDSHAAISLMALVWLALAAGQIWRLRSSQTMRWPRIVLAVLYGLPGFALLAVSSTILNPLFALWDVAFGPPLIDSLFIAYGLVGLFFLAVAIRFDHLTKWLRYAIGALGVFYAGLYIALEIRRFWRGDDLTVPGTTPPELYTYTVAMLIASTGLLFYAFFKKSPWLRKLALAGLGLTIAKVFLIDASGLQGLMRVFSFLVLGLAIAGLAWLDRWFGAKGEAEDGQATP